MATKSDTCRYVDSVVIPLLLTGIGGIGSRVRQMFLSGDHLGVANLSISPLDYRDSSLFQRDYAAVSLLKKYPGLNTGIDTRKVALDKFEVSEDVCADVNFRLLASYRQKPHVYEILRLARSECRLILGKFSWDRTEPFLSFGPGASVGNPRRRSHPYYKIGHKEPTATGECLTVDAAFIESAPLWKKFREANGIHPKVCLGSKLITVPKDARTDRVIAVEPLLNMFYQKGIGGLMRSRLKRAGCDLNDQSLNQVLAYKGSKDGEVATIDLASASDSISRELVEVILPEDWLVGLKSVRCVNTCLSFDKASGLTPWFLSKFSSMGNGYTFELESLLFLTLARAVAKFYKMRGRVISVYGDDIVTSVDLAPVLIELLAEVGFMTNVEKTFLAGSFRESCGKHFFSGRDVTPFYLKHMVDDQESLLWLLNSIRRLAHRFTGIGWGCDGDLLPAWQSCLAGLTDRYKDLSIPEGFGDGAVVRDFDEVCPTPKSRKGWVEGYTTQHHVRKYSTLQKSGEGLLVLSLHALEKRASEPVKDRKGDVSKVNSPRYRLAKKLLQVPQWPSLGPWLALD